MFLTKDVSKKHSFEISRCVLLRTFEVCWPSENLYSGLVTMKGLWILGMFMVIVSPDYVSLKKPPRSLSDRLPVWSLKGP